MSDDITGREKELAGKIDRLKDQAARPQIEGGGWLGDALNFVATKAPVLLIRLALLVFVAYEAFAYYSKAQEQAAALTEKRAQVTQVDADAAAVRTKIGGDTAELARLKAELVKLQSDSITADADARAQAQRMGEGTARLASIRAEIETAQNEATRLRAEVDAQNQNIAGLPLIVSKKRNDVEAAETAVEQEVWSQHLVIEGMKRGDWRIYGLGPLLGRSPDEDGIKRYPMTQIFDELHAQVR